MKRQRTGHSRVFRRLSVLLVLAFIVPIVPTGPTGQAGLSEMPYRLVPAMTSSIGAEQRALSSSESLVVWEDSRSGTPDVYVYDVNDSREFRASTDDAVRSSPAVDEPVIIWVSGESAEESTIRGIDLAEGVEFAVTDEPYEVDNPIISSDVIAWQERRDDGWIIHVADRGGNRITTLGEDAVNTGRTAAHGTTIVWEEHDGESWNLRLHDVDDQETRSLTSGSADDRQPTIFGDSVAFVRTSETGGSPQLVLLSANGGDEQVIVEGHFLQRPSIHDRLLVWEDWRSGLPDIYAHDLIERETFAVARSQQANQPVVTDRFISWISGNDPASQRIQTLEIQERLPTDPQDPPAVPSPDSLYIPETRHSVSSGFKAFWQSHGGPEILGYPLSTEFTEEDPDTGEEIAVQYFERVKLEFHPNAPHDNRIRMARLGVELRPERETEPVEPFESDDNRRYFPETGQAIQGGFKDFWENHGGVGVFGYPLTGEFSENGRAVQYFERARFEHDPESGGGQVQLGLLGREALQERGWLPPPPVDTTQVFE